MPHATPVTIPPASTPEELRRSVESALNRLVTQINREDLSSDISANQHRIKDLARPAAGGDAVNLSYLEDAIQPITQRLSRSRVEAAGSPTSIYAPNVTSATAEVVAETVAGKDYYHFGGTVTLPTASPNFSELKWVHIVAIGPRPLLDERPMGVICVPEVTSPVNWQSDSWPWPEGGGIYDFEFRCENWAAVITPNAYRVEGVEVVGKPPAPLNPTTVTAHEHVDERTAELNGLISTPIDVEYTLPPDHNADYVMVWVTNYAGDGWDLAGKWWLSETIRFWRLVPAAGANWKVRIISARWDAEANAPLESAEFAIAPIAVAEGSWITDAAIGTIGYGTGYLGVGAGVWWGIDHVTWTNPVGKPFYHAVMSVQKVDVNGTAAPDDEGVEREFREFTFEGDGINVDFPILWWTIPEPTSDYRYFQFRLYCVTRDANYTRVLQTAAWSGQPFIRFEVPPPPAGGYLDLSKVDPNTVGQGLTVKDGKLGKSSGHSDNIIDNPNFEDELGAEWQYSVSSAGVTRETTGGRSGPACLRLANTNHGVYQAPITANAGDQFAFKAWFYKEAGTNREVYLTLLAYDGSDAYLGHLDVTVSQAIADATWTESTTGIFTCPANTAYVMLRINPASEMSAGAWRVDSVEMRLRVGAEILKDQSVTAAKMAANAITAANQALAASSVVDSNMVSVSVSKLIAGTVIFTGDAVFSRGTGLPVQVLNNAGIYLFAVDSGGGIGAGNAPYVAIEGGGISLFAGASSRSVTLTSTALTLWTVSGNSNSPYVQLTSTGIVVSGGGSGPAISLSSTGAITGCTLVLESDGVRTEVNNPNEGGYIYSMRISATNGSSKLLIRPSQVEIRNASNTTVAQVYVNPNYGSGEMFITDGTRSFSVTTESTGRVQANGLDLVTDRNVKVGSAYGLYVGSYKVVGARQAAVADPSGGSVIDVQARTAIGDIIDRLQAHGLIA